MRVYQSELDRPANDRIRVGIADLAVGTDGSVLHSSGFGSCVGVALVDSSTGVSGLAHVMLPESDGVGKPAKFADTAVPALVDAMVERGARRDRIRAKVAGGSEMFQFANEGGSIGVRNVEAIRTALENLDIPLAAEDVGGTHGRSLELRGDELVVTSAQHGTVAL